MNICGPGTEAMTRERRIIYVSPLYLFLTEMLKLCIFSLYFVHLSVILK
jgi:hypothetical protein